jgi:hypothetical protein
MSKRPNFAELEALFDAMVAWGFLEEDPGPPRGWRPTALWLQSDRFLQAPQEEPGFLAAWTAAVERRDREHGLDDALSGRLGNPTAPRTSTSASGIGRSSRRQTGGSRTPCGVTSPIGRPPWNGSRSSRGQSS